LELRLQNRRTEMSAPKSVSNWREVLPVEDCYEITEEWLDGLHDQLIDEEWELEEKDEFGAAESVRELQQAVEVILGRIRREMKGLDRKPTGSVKLIATDLTVTVHEQSRQDLFG
jgi:hypothetical protein